MILPLVAIGFLNQFDRPVTQPLMSAWMVFYDDGQSLADFKAHARQLDVVSADWIECRKNGDLVYRNPPTSAQQEQAKQIAKENGVILLGTVSNAGEADFAPDGVEEHLGSVGEELDHANDLVKMALDSGLDGLDLDYESLRAKDRPAFSSFVNILAEACHKRRLLLAIAVHAKEKEPGSWEGSMAQDYPSLGRNVDFFRVMSYDESQEAGPVGSIGLARRNMDYTLANVARGKVDLGIPGYGYDWDGTKNSDVDWSAFSALAKAHPSGLSRDSATQELVLKFGTHTVSFADAIAERGKWDLAAQLNLHGVCLWRLGTEDPGMWSFIPKRP